MNLTFFSPQFPLCSWAISYTVHCAFVWLFFLFISLYLIQFIIQGPFVPPLSGHTKRCTQYGWGFVHILSSSPLGCRIREEYLEQAFSYCAQEARQTQKGKSRWGAQLKDKRFWEALTPKAKLFCYAWCVFGTLKWKEWQYYFAIMHVDVVSFCFQTTKSTAKNTTKLAQ